MAKQAAQITSAQKNGELVNPGKRENRNGEENLEASRQGGDSNKNL